MAYVGNSLSCVAQTIEGTVNIYVYVSTDTIATINGAGYFSDGASRGMTVGDLVAAINPTTGAMTWLSVTSVSGLAVTTATASGSGLSGYIPETKYTTGALTAATLTAAQVAGGKFTALNNSGNTPGTQTLPAASVLFAAIPGAQVGFNYILRILNAGTGTLTLAADAGATITVTGHTSILTLTWVDYIVTFTSAIAATVQSIGAGVAP